MCRHKPEAVASAWTAARTTSAVDCAAAALFALGAWLWSKLLVPTHIRPYPGTNVTLDGGAQVRLTDF